MVRWTVAVSDLTVFDAFMRTRPPVTFVIVLVMQHARSRFLCAAFVLSLLGACGKGDSPEQRVHEVIAQVERAAEARDTGEVTEWLSSEYRDAHGHSVKDVKRVLRGYFIANQSIRLLTRVEELTFPHPGEARARVLVGMVNREADAANAWEMAADLNEFELVLMEEDGEWRVTWARWRRN